MTDEWDKLYDAATTYGTSTIAAFNLSGIERLRAALENLANACDVVGVAFFDTDSMDPAVGDMQRATQAARNLLKTI